MTLVLTKNEMCSIEEIIEKELLSSGAHHVIIADTSGNLIMERGSLHVPDILSLAVLLAANFAATAEIARMIGETDFSLLFHKGDKENIHFSRLGSNHIIITLFDDTVSLGLIRLKSVSAIDQLGSVLEEREGRRTWPL
ncbi:MAG: roadblock/LC7 domain-containing protein [Syntrophobacteraceae bacterium]